MTVTPHSLVPSSPRKPAARSLAVLDEDDLATQIASALLTSIAKGAGAPIGGWVATYLGLGGDTTTQQFMQIAMQLTNLQTELNTVNGQLTNDFNQLMLQADANNVSMQASWIPTNVGALPTLTGANLAMEISDIEANANYLLMLANNQLGALPGDTGPFISLWTNVYAPQFYIDAVQKGIIHQQYDYYQQLQFAMMLLLVEAYHMPTNGDPANGINPSPPNYDLAQKYFQQYYDMLQLQSTLLPYPTSGTYASGEAYTLGYTGSVPDTGCTTAVYDSVNGIGWGTSNRASIASLTDIVTAFGLGSNQELNPVRFPTLSELESLSGSNNVTTLPAYNHVTQIMPPLASPPDTQSYLNAMGFNLAFVNFSPNLYYPCVTYEAVNDSSVWTQLTRNVILPEGGAITYVVGWSSDMFYDVVLGQQVTVAIKFAETLDTNGVFSDLMNYPTTSITFTNYLGASTSDVGLGSYLDMIFVLDLVTNAPVTEPTNLVLAPVDPSWGIGSPSSDNGDGTYTLKAAGYWLGTSWLDVTDTVYWQVTSGPATVSNMPGSTGLLTWTGSGTAEVLVTRRALSAGSTFQSPANVPAPTTVAANIYPRQFDFNGQAPFNSQVWVQRVLSLGAPTLDDDTANFMLSSSVDWLKFTSTDGSGTFTINEDAPVGSSQVTITATDKTGSGVQDSVTFTVTISQAQKVGNA